MALCRRTSPELLHGQVPPFFICADRFSCAAKMEALRGGHGWPRGRDSCRLGNGGFALDSSLCAIPSKSTNQSDTISAKLPFGRGSLELEPAPGMALYGGDARGYLLPCISAS